MTNRNGSESTTPGARWMTTGAIAIIATLTLLAGPLAGSAAAHAGQDTFTVEPRESGCSGSQYCYKATEGDLANISAGDSVKIIFKNPDSNSAAHNIHVTLPDDADSSNEDTPESAAFASSDTIQPGEEVEIQFQVPSGSDGLYLWCDVSGHESLGMWEELTFSGSSDGGSGDSGNEQNGSPFPTAGAILALAGLALVLKRRS